MEEAEAVLILEDALLCADLARTAGIILKHPLEQREFTFLDAFGRVEEVLSDYTTEVEAALLLARALATTDAGAAAADLGEPAAALIDQHILSLALSDRIPGWIAEVVWHLGEEVGDRTDSRLVTIETLCAGWRLHRPTSAAYLFALASALGAADAQGDGELADLLTADQGICEMVPALLGNSGVGRVMATGSWAPAIATASRAGLIDRDTLLDLALAQRASVRLDDLQFFLVLHDQLDPSNAEMSARVDAYERLLSDERDAVTTSVADVLYRRDERRPLPTETLVAITRAIFAKEGSQQSSRHVAWLREAVGRNPQSAGRLAVALIEGMASSDRTLAEQSLDAVVAMLDVADIDTVDSVRAPMARAISALPADVASIAAGRLGVALDHSAIERAGRHAATRPDMPVQVTATTRSRIRTPGTGRPRPSFSVPELPSPVRTHDGLTLLAGQYLIDLDPLIGEFVLDGVAALAGADLAATATALAPLVPILEDVAMADEASDPGLWLGERPILAALARLALPTSHPVHDHPWRVPAGPQGCLTRRAQEVLFRAQAGQTQELLATPTEVTGALDPTVLVERIADLARSGNSGWPMDAEQAFLRAHGTDIAPEVITALAEVNSPLALRAERRLRQGVLARPPLRVALEDGTVRITAGPARVHTDDGPLTRQALMIEGVNEAQPGSALPVLMTLPHHRELAAAYLVAPLSDPSRRHLLEDLRALAMLGHAEGRTADATALTLLFGAAQRHEADRPAAVSAIEQLADGWFDVEGCAQVWRWAVKLPLIDLDHVAATLAEVSLSPRTARLLCKLAGAARWAADRTGSPAATRLGEIELAAEQAGDETGDAAAPQGTPLPAAVS